MPFPFPAPWEHILMPLRIILLTNFDHAKQLLKHFLLESVKKLSVALCHVSERLMVDTLTCYLQDTLQFDDVRFLQNQSF